jgi:Zn-dependent protease
LIWLHSNLVDSDFSLFLVLLASTVFALMVGITFHECSHALAATALGDKLPRSQGRVSLNPMSHIEPLGAVMMLFIGFGWGKPVQHNPYGLKLSPKFVTLLVASAGPVSNFVVAFLLAVPIKAGMVPYVNPFGSVYFVSGMREYLGLFLTGAVYMNIILGIFNLIPLPPLDGYNVALAILPKDLREPFARLNQYGPGPLLIILFLLPYVTGRNLLADIMGPPVIRLLRAFTGIG